MGRETTTASAFECIAHFIDETRSKTYLDTLRRELKSKNALNAKNNLQLQTCSEVESCGV